LNDYVDRFLKNKLLFIPFKIFKKCSISFKLWILWLIVKKFLCWENGVLQWAWRKHNPLSSLLHSFQGKSGKVLSNNILMYVEKPLLMNNAKKIIWNAYDKPINSCLHSYMINPNEYHDEPKWRSSRMQQHSEVFSRTQQYYEDHNIYLDLQVKALGPGHIAQHHWSPSNGYKSPTNI